MAGVTARAYLFEENSLAVETLGVPCSRLRLFPYMLDSWTDVELLEHMYLQHREVVYGLYVGESDIRGSLSAVEDYDLMGGMSRLPVSDRHRYICRVLEMAYPTSYLGSWFVLTKVVVEASSLS